MWRASLRPASAPRTPRRNPIPSWRTRFRGKVAAVLAASPARAARRGLGTILQVSELAAVALFAHVALRVSEEHAGRLVGVPARRQSWACPMLGKGEAKEVGATLRTCRRWSSGFLCGAAGISTSGRASGGAVVVVPPGTPILVGFALSVAVTVARGHDRLSCRLVPKVVLVALESVLFDGSEDPLTKPFVGLVGVAVFHLVVVMHVLA